MLTVLRVAASILAYDSMSLSDAYFKVFTVVVIIYLVSILFVVQ